MLKKEFDPIFHENGKWNHENEHRHRKGNRPHEAAAEKEQCPRNEQADKRKYRERQIISHSRLPASPARAPVTEEKRNSGQKEKRDPDGLEFPGAWLRADRGSPSFGLRRSRGVRFVTSAGSVSGGRRNACASKQWKVRWRDTCATRPTCQNLASSNPDQVEGNKRNQ